MHPSLFEIKRVMCGRDRVVVRIIMFVTVRVRGLRRNGQTFSTGPSEAEIFVFAITRFTCIVLPATDSFFSAPRATRPWVSSRKNTAAWWVSSGPAAGPPRTVCRSGRPWNSADPWPPDPLRTRSRSTPRPRRTRRRGICVCAPVGVEKFRKKIFVSFCAERRKMISYIAPSAL